MPKKVLQVLLVDDDEEDFMLISDCLHDIPDYRINIIWAANYDQALVHLSEDYFDICFFDHYLGARTGLDLLRIARDLQVKTPIILLTGRGNMHLDTEAMQLGVTDYLIKGELEPEKLERIIRYAIERTASLKALRESEQKYRGLFEASMDVICLLDEAGNFKDVNDSATRMLGFSREEFLQKKITDIFETERAKALFLNNLIKKESIADFETNFVAANGDIKHCIIACTCHRMPGHTEAVFFQGILHDNTRRKKAEQDLLIAEKLAATASFVRILGHEIRNPLTNIDLSISQLAAENQDAELLDYIEIIQRNSKRIGQLLTDLLQSSNPGQLHLQLIQPEALIDQAIALATDRMALKGIRVQTSYDPNLHPVAVDPEKLKIALLNILINAIEILPECKGFISVSARQDLSGCRITIRDNGPGIPQEHLNKLFDPYFTRKPNGMGLGLASTMNIVQLHKGWIEVRSELGKGAEFIIHLGGHNT